MYKVDAIFEFRKVNNFSKLRQKKAGSILAQNLVVGQFEFFALVFTAENMRGRVFAESLRVNSASLVLCGF